MDTKLENYQLQTTEENPGGLIALAIEKNVDIDKLERLLALKERYDAVQAQKSFLKSLSEFQANVPEIHKSKQVKYTPKNGGFPVNYKYAEIGDIDEAIKQSMSAAGLSKRWEITEEGESIICTCIISHINGHSERTSMSSLKDQSGGKNDIQSRASAITYLQRYTLIGALGLTTASDDDDATQSNVRSQNNNTQHEAVLPWLNVTDKLGNKTTEGLQVIADLQSGKTSVDALLTQYKINKPTVDELRKIKPASPNNTNNGAAKNNHVGITQPDPNPFTVPGNWLAKVEKWKTVEDVIATYNDKVATLNATGELAEFFFKEAMAICKSKKDVLSIYNACKTTIDAMPSLQQILKTKQSQIAK
jgi:hypothetical protein